MQVAGSIALLPAAVALIATSMKFQGKANWHYRKKEALEGLRCRLQFELPESPSADDVASISESFRGITEKMTKEWEKELALDFSYFAKKKHKV